MPKVSPLLLILFNRPIYTKQLVDQISSLPEEIRPTEIYVAVDGARIQVPHEMQVVNEVKFIVENSLGWANNLYFRYQSTNLGLKLAVIDALNWFFSHVDEGLILEDDCIPHVDFFSYCYDLLERYRFNDRVWLISGDNSPGLNIDGDSSYGFIPDSLIWGWASWRRIWFKHETEMLLWKQIRHTHIARKLFQSKDQYKCRSQMYDLVLDKGIPDTWDIQFSASCRIYGGLCAIPRHNLITNIGFGFGATNTISMSSRANCDVHPILPLVHPVRVEADILATHELFFKAQYGEEWIASHGPNLWLNRFRRLINVIKSHLNK